MSEQQKTIVLTVVVNGQPLEHQALRRQKWCSIIAPCLQRTGQTGQPAEMWELRNEAGALIALDQKIGLFDHSIRLFLNLRAGIGA